MHLFHVKSRHQKKKPRCFVYW